MRSWTELHDIESRRQAVVARRHGLTTRRYRTYRPHYHSSPLTLRLLSQTNAERGRPQHHVLSKTQREQHNTIRRRHEAFNSSGATILRIILASSTYAPVVICGGSVYKLAGDKTAHCSARGPCPGQTKKSPQQPSTADRLRSSTRERERLLSTRERKASPCAFSTRPCPGR